MTIFQDIAAILGTTMVLAVSMAVGISRVEIALARRAHHYGTSHPTQPV